MCDTGSPLKYAAASASAFTVGVLPLAPVFLSCFDITSAFVNCPAGIAGSVSWASAFRSLTGHFTPDVLSLYIDAIPALTLSALLRVPH